MSADNEGEQKSVAKRAKKCFVVSAFDDRGDSFFEEYVKPACSVDGFTAERADRQLTSEIVKGIDTSLGISPMVIAYLASPPWNENVLLELGYRMATRLPLVIVCDEPPAGENLRLPFHMGQKRIVRIPTNPVNSDVRRTAIVNKLVSLIRKSTKECAPFSSNQAVAMIHAPRGSLDADQAIYAAATPRATKLFGVNGELVGRSLATFVADRKEDMPDYQFTAFLWEQGRLAVDASPDGPPVIATTPIVFSKGPNKARAYLPIIVNYQEIGDVQEIRVLYLDVTSDVKLVTHNVLNITYYVSTLNPDGPRIPNFHEPKNDRADQCGDGVFLAHNSADKDRVRPIYELLKQHGGSPWFDEVCIRPGANWLNEIEAGMTSCRAAFVFVGKNGYGNFQGKHEIQQFFFDMLQDERIPLVPILMDDVQEPPRLLRGYQAVRYDVANTSEWINAFVRDELPAKGDGSRPKQPR